MFGKYNNNGFGGNSINVNTKIYTSYSDDSLLTLSAWNANLSLKLQPAKGKNEDGVTVYSTEQVETVTASITPETDQLLLAGIEKDILPAIKEKASASIGVVTGVADKRKVINVITTDGKVGLSVVFGGTINLDGTSTGTSLIQHTFNDRSYYTNYKQNDGGTANQIPSDFYAFVAKLKELKYVDGAISHGIAYSTSIKSAIAASKNTPAESTSQNTYSAPVTNVGDGSIDEFIPFS